MKNKNKKKTGKNVNKTGNKKARQSKIFVGLRIFLMSLFAIILVGIVSVVGLNMFVHAKDRGYILTMEEANNLSDVDCIIVLGASVYDRSTPSPMLADRIDEGISLYQNNVSNKIIMSGDHGSVYYDEVGTMKGYAKKAGVAAEDIFMDHAGFSTYETMFRAKEVFGAKKVVIVTQSYHLYRAVYIARALGLDAYGVAAEQKTYSGQFKRDLREYLAIAKDVVKCIVKPNPTFLGEAIDLKGSGNVTGEGY